MIDLQSISKHLQPALFCAVAGLAACDGQTGDSDDLRAFEQDLLVRINQLRAANGCGPVSEDASLRAAALRYAVDLRENPDIRQDPNGIGSDGSTPEQRIIEAGYTPLDWRGEIWYWNYAPYNTVDATIDTWMNNPTTRAIIAPCQYTHAGVGLVNPGDELFAVVTFASHGESPVGRTDEQNLLARINEKRAAVGCGPVVEDANLRAAAMRHAADMRDNPVVRDDPNHIGSDGSTPLQRISEAGFMPVSWWGEIMYWGDGAPYNTVDANIDWWMNSPGHRANIENCTFTHAGVGLVRPGDEWYSVVDFAAH